MFILQLSGDQNMEDQLPIKKNNRVQILSTTLSGCEKYWSTFPLIYMKLQNCESYYHLERMVYVDYKIYLIKGHNRRERRTRMMQIHLIIDVSKIQSDDGLAKHDYGRESISWWSRRFNTAISNFYITNWRRASCKRWWWGR